MLILRASKCSPLLARERIVDVARAAGGEGISGHEVVSMERDPSQLKTNRERSRVLSTDRRVAYQRRWMAARRAEFFAGKSCEKCGSSDRLELDHLDPGQKEEHRIWSWSDDRRAAELAKCRVLCRDCHVKRHADERRKPLRHGTANAYKKRGCRCVGCRAWNAKYKGDLRIAHAADGQSTRAA